MSSDAAKCRSSLGYKTGAFAKEPAAVIEVSINRSTYATQAVVDYVEVILSKRWKLYNYYEDDTAFTQTTGDVSYPASGNTAAVVTYAADPYNAHVIQEVYFSYNGAPTSGTLKIEDGSGVVVFNEDVVSSGNGAVDFSGNNGFKGSNNTAMIITLSAAGSGVTGKLNVVGHRLERP